METGYIPNKTAEIQEEISGFETDPYRESVRYDHSLPLRGIWMRGEFSLENCTGARVITKGDEQLRRISMDEV